MPTEIAWCDETWNPTTGCTKVSPGCKHCYADRMAKRLKAMGVPQYRNGFKLTLQPDMLDVPHRWRKPRVVFVNSMSDLFQKGVPLEFIQQVFAVMQTASQHTYQILTKRPEIAPYIRTQTFTYKKKVGDLEIKADVHRLDDERGSGRWSCRFTEGH